MRNTVSSISIQDQIKELESQRDDAQAAYDSVEAQKFQDQIDKLKNQKKPAKTPETKKQDYSEMFDLLIKAWIVPASMDKDILQKQLAQAELERSWKADQAFNKQSKDEIIKQLKESLTQKDTMLNNLAMTKETLINHEFLRHRKLKKMYARIQKLKQKWDNGKSAVIYFMAMESRRTGWKVWAAFNRWIMKMGLFNTENVKRFMKTCLERYAEKNWDSEKTKTLKRIVYAEIKDITNNYLDSVTKSNRIE